MAFSQENTFMALTTSELEIMRFIQTHGKTTPADFIRGMKMGDDSRVTIRKAMIRLEAQGFLSSEPGGAQVRKYSIHPNVKKVDFAKLENL
jgi:predicted transcriptional regulator